MTDKQPEFSRPVDLTEIEAGPVTQAIEADETERRNLAKRFGLSALDALTASVSLRHRDRHTILAEGAFKATVVQTCVITLEPLPRSVSESFSLLLTTEPDADPPEIVDVDSSGAVDVEPFEGDLIDIGELVAQHLALALDPYPRAEGAMIAPEALTSGEESAVGPFAELARLKPKT